MVILRWVLVKLVDVGHWAQKATGGNIVEASRSLVAKDVISVLDVNELDDRPLNSGKVIAAGLLRDAGNLWVK